MMNWNQKATVAKDLYVQFHLPSSFVNHHWTKEDTGISEKTIIYLRI